MFGIILPLGTQYMFETGNGTEIGAKGQGLTPVTDSGD